MTILYGLTIVNQDIVWMKKAQTMSRQTTTMRMKSSMKETVACTVGVTLFHPCGNTNQKLHGQMGFPVHGIQKSIMN